MKCQNCGENLPSYPRDAVENDEIDEVVAHIQDGDESFEVAKTDYYCDLECAAEAVGGDEA